MQFYVSIELARQHGIDTYIVLVAGTAVAVYPSLAGAQQYCKRLEETLGRQVVNCNDWRAV